MRQSIRKFAFRQSELLNSIGTAHLEQEIQKRVVGMSRQMQVSIQEESGIKSSLDEQAVKSYIEEVLKEVKKDRNT